MKKRILSMVLCMCMLMTFLYGCSNNNVQDDSAGSQTQANANEDVKNANEGDTQESGPITELTLPLTENKETITAWIGWSNSYVESPNELPAVQEMENLTNVHVEWTTVDSSEMAEKFGLMIASGDTCDITHFADFVQYPGGGMKSIEDGVFMDCEELIENYMPNYKALIETNAKFKADTIEEDGKRHLIYGVHGNGTEVKPEDDWDGLVIRQDWLDELGLETPETIQEWHDVLVAFKEQKGASAPLSIGQGGYTALAPFLTAYGVHPGFMMKDGAVTYGPLLEGYKQWIELFREWYAEGLIDPNFMTVGPSGVYMPPMEYIGGEMTGAFNVPWSFAGNTFHAMGVASNENFYLTAVSNPVLNEGDEPAALPVSSSGSGAGPNVFIGANCENPELVAKWIDYQYTPEAIALNFYGIEGETYTIGEDGEYAYTDYVMNNPDGLTPSDAIKTHTISYAVGYYDWQSVEHYTANGTALAEAKRIWTEQNHDMTYYVGKTNMNSEEEVEYNRLFPAIETLVNENTVKYIMGTESMDTYDDFVQSLYDYGIERCIAIKQAVYDRYQSKFAE